MTIQSNNNNLNYLTDPTFIKVSRLFVLLVNRIAGENNTTKDHRDSFSHYIVPNVEIKDFKLNDKIIEISKNSAYTTGNLLDFAYFKVNCRLIAIDLSKQTKLKDPQRSSFIGKLEGQNNGATMFFITEKSEETTFEFLQNSVNIL